MITPLRTYMGLSAVLLMSASIAPRAIAVDWTDPNNQFWTYSNWGLSSTVYVRGSCWGDFARKNRIIDVVFKQEYCPNAVLQGNTATLQCIGQRNLTITPANHIFRGSGFVGAGLAYGEACGQSVNFEIKGTKPQDNINNLGLVFHTNNESGDLFSSPVGTPEQLPVCSGALQSTTLTWENLLIGDNISRKTIPFVYKCEFGGGDISINITETTVSHEAPKLQYDIGGDIFTDSYSLSCSDSCEKSIDFGVSGKSAVTAAGKFTYSLLVNTYQK